MIAKVVITPVAFADAPLLNASGVHQPWALRSIVEVHCDEFVGLGETYGDAQHLDLLRKAGATLAGLDPFDLNGLARRVSAAIGDVDAPDKHGLTGPSTAEKTTLRVLSPFEVAFLDLQGQMTGRPLVDLLGGKVRDRVPFSAYLFYKWEGDDPYGEAVSPEGIVAQAGQLIERYGFTSIKLKGGVFSPDEEVEAIRALREAYPLMPLRLDPNAVWTVPTAVRIAKETEGLLEYLEDPTRGIAGMAEVARTAPMPLATNMCVVKPDDIEPAFTQKAVGVVLSDHHYWGGLRRSAELAAICRTWGIGVSMHSNSHLGISLAAMTHLGGALPELTYAADTHTPWQLGVDVLASPLPIVDGAVTVPSGPGLGVSLDRDVLARMHEDYLSCGIRERDDTGYMRTFQPDWQRPTW
ncbi:enolase C-terminal domain-like protein [Catelliglobosispora koreensis]|uniref:enolase C-terminal domain-like protein n=1 Tax=Catelliglobosispora koreensis TaxID=129052 RepID=UPI0003678C70|nr:enolase C-terminal domain-like protein [Catelliglobosispora koreensis]